MVLSYIELGKAVKYNRKREAHKEKQAKQVNRPMKQTGQERTKAKNKQHWLKNNVKNKIKNNFHNKKLCIVAKKETRLYERVVLLYKGVAAGKNE